MHYMGRYKSLIIARYLVKERVINPLFKRHRKILLGAILVIVFLVAGLVIASSLIPSQETNNNRVSTSQSPRFSTGIRSFIHSIGLNGNKIIDIISLTLMLYLIIGIIRGGRLVVSEAVYELVLSQPINTNTYVIGDTLYKIITGLIITPLYFSFVPFAIDCNGGSLKALFIPFSIFTLFFLFGELCNKMTVAISRFAEKQGIIKHLRLILITYLLAATIHSIILRYPSPLLTIPLRGFSELLVYPFTISRTVSDLILSLLKAYSIIILCFIIVSYTSNYLIPEDVIPLKEIIRERMSKSLQKTRAIRLRFDNHSIAVRTYILGNSIMRLRHIVNIGILLAIVVTVAYIARYIILVTYGPVGIKSSFITTTLIPITIIISSNTVIGIFLANDIPGYWVYRVYLIRMDSVAFSFLLKYIVYLFEALLLMSIIDTIISQNYLFLLFPLTTLPLITTASFLILAILVYFASKKKIIKYMETRMTVLEETASGAILAVLIMFTLLSKIGYTVMLSMNPSPILILATVSSATMLSIILFIVFSKILAKLMERYDIVS